MTAADPVKDLNVQIRPLGSQEWPVFRSLRLRALEDAPEAFGSTAAEARGLSAQAWRARLEARSAFVAMAGDAAIGLVAAVPGERPGQAELISMWVDPRWRGRGVGDGLVEAVVAWARARGFETVRLWVTEGNVRAERLYRRRGFRATGEAQPIGSRRSAMEFAMVLDLRG